MRQTLGVGPESPVRTLIQRRLLRVSANSSVGATARAMRQVNVSSALTEDGKAIVTERDLARALASGLGPEASVAAVYVPNPITIPASTSIVDAAADMLHKEIRHLVVTDHGDVLGVISLRDVVAVLLEGLDPAVWVTTLREAVKTRTEMWLG
jgi:CBS domain-containing protein